jgi:hypothetical protein
MHDTAAPENDREPWSFLAPLSVFVLIGAAIAIALAWATYYVSCDEVTSDACDLRGLARAQLVVAVGGLVPALGMALAASRKRNALALVCFALAALVYAVWAFLNDAAVHGWGPDMTLM